MEDAKELAQRKLEERRFPLGIYKHRKGGRYVAFAVSLKEDTMEEVVHYFSIVRCTRWRAGSRRGRCTRSASATGRTRTSRRSI